jgi:alanine-glyoxylate transaminase/serine-glyoxylate transaminase/serine-pyruvate transaminase
MARPTLDFFADEFLAIQRRVHAALMQVLKTEQNLLMYAANGHGAWEAALVNVLNPGSLVLMLESGRFSESWSEMARALGYDVETLTADWRTGVAPDALAERLRRDTGHAIKAVLAVHNETSAGTTLPIAELRRAIDDARHPALYMVDTISSLGSMDFRMDGWGVDLAVGGSQKGLMMATGLSFTGISKRALEMSEGRGARRSYWDWKEMRSVAPQRFPGTTPVHLFYGLEASLDLIADEGLEAIFARHTRLARATRAAVAHWGGGARSGVRITSKGIEGRVGAIELLPREAARASDSVTAILLPDGHDANHLRKIALDHYNVSLGGGLSVLAGRVFRIGHMGDLNEPMLLGALATVEMALADCAIPHQAGGVGAAIAELRRASA